MKVTQVSIRPTQAAERAGRPALTPELLAATGARYSRSNEGLEAIVARIDPGNPDKSVDSIFRHLDYGHQSIADMTPVALFIDGVSIYLAYYIWSLVEVGGGQESSTRYIELSPEGVLTAAEAGLPVALQKEYDDFIRDSFTTYQDALSLWHGVAESRPDLMRIPSDLLRDPSEKAKKAVARMRRNFAFDRSRVFLPVAAKTNLMLVTSARAWVGIASDLLSGSLPEAIRVGEAIREELALAAPRMLKYARREEATAAVIAESFDMAQASSRDVRTSEFGTFFCSPSGAFLHATPPSMPFGHLVDSRMDHALRERTNRYSRAKSLPSLTSVNYGWGAVSMGEIRDMNRHRPGSRFCPLGPVGFYAALDQVPEEMKGERLHLEDWEMWIGRTSFARAAQLLIHEGEPSYVYLTSLGTQYPFARANLAHKFIYEAELRTGTGAHYRYAQHYRDVLSLWYQAYPETRELVFEGVSEPE